MIGKPGLGSLLLLGAAAFGAYKYSQLSDEQKKSLMDKGKKFFDEQLGGLKNVFGQQEGQQQPAGAGGGFGPNGSTQG